MPSLWWRVFMAVTGVWMVYTAVRALQSSTPPEDFTIKAITTTLLLIGGSVALYAAWNWNGR